MGEGALAPGEYPWPTQIQWPTSEGPYVRVASLCEDVIDERNGSLSAFRLLNRLIVRGNPVLPISIPTTLFLALEGFSKDREAHQITISVASPVSNQVVNETVNLTPFGPFREYNLDMSMAFPVISYGEHAIAIISESRILSVLKVSVELESEGEIETNHRILFSHLEETSYSPTGKATRRTTLKSPGVVEETSE